MTRTALAFYEDDEDPAEILARFEAGIWLTTARPATTTTSTTVTPNVEWTSD